MRCEITRLAPSPTGALHLGNARTFLINYLLAARGGWRVLMRIEDLDGPRIKAGAAGQLLEELAWLGLTWQEPIVYQSTRAYAYEDALGKLAQAGLAYPCTCSRKDIALAGGAPHADDAVDAYPGSCRERYTSAEHAAQTGRPVAWRLRVTDEPIEFADEFRGPQRVNLAASGDFVIYKSDGLAAYQLAVVVDDAAAGVDAIVRGDDLLESAGRQIYLRRVLGLAPAVRYWHLPLVIGPDGRRLAKRHGDTRLAHYRQLGCTAERMLGLLGFWSGIISARRESSLDELLDQFDLDCVSRQPIVFNQADDAFLAGRPTTTR